MKAHPIFNLPAHKQRRQDLRNNLTEPERLFWGAIKSSQLGVKFRRQHGIGIYIADFYCPSLNLIIELDGDSHFTSSMEKYDKARESYFYNLGLVVLRYKNDEVMSNLSGILADLTDRFELLNYMPST
tara:strand:+ start:724 stop:1107 length:384 start_codon:yes stop_codon:yes gene_type:complete